VEQVDNDSNDRWNGEFSSQCKSSNITYICVFIYTYVSLELLDMNIYVPVDNDSNDRWNGEFSSQCKHIYINRNMNTNLSVSIYVYVYVYIYVS
jgi:hypothetical protein